jgi:cytosine/adenosine deaminase-related metal-dependent hydrolase
MSNQTLYRARFVLPISTPLIEDGAILVESGLVRAVGCYHQLAADNPNTDVIDFGESVLLPPMVNAHTHLELSAFGEWAVAAGEPKSPQAFVDWILWLVRIRRTVSEAQIKDSLSAGLQLSLRAGTGAVGDIFTTLSAVDAFLNTPLNGKIYAEVLGQDPALVDERLVDVKALAARQPARNLIWGLAPHSPYTLSSSAIDKVFAFAKEHAFQCSIHLAESTDETEFLHDGTGEIADKLYASAKWNPLTSSPPGCSPVSALCGEGRLKGGDMVVHGVHVDMADIEQLKEKGCALTLCPRSNATLDTGKAPVASYLEAGVPLALGTDSLASSGSLSIWDEMAFASKWFAGAAEPSQWLEIATLGGAKALGLQERIGQLAPGLEASFQVVTLPEMPDAEALEETLCVSGKDVIVSHLYLSAENVLPQS